ncbi:MAG: putative rane protein [Acidimicrobiales bacterium]|nr:putative rane protein [Acidimicrobiales bacterium]
MTATLATASPAPAPPAPRALRAWARVFAAKPTPKIIAAYFVAALGARAALGRWTWLDLVPALVILALEPFTEWAIHVVILHWRPRRLFGHEIDLATAQEHRAHHADPRDLDLVFVPLRVILFWVPLLSAIVLVALPTRVASSAIAASMAMLLTYEWTHMLIHSPYQPRHRYYRSIWRAHRLHHYRNERYWFGVTVTAADRVLHTFPEKHDVELSPTVRTLGVHGGV